MGGQMPEKTKKHICAGLLAHVDAGKTTLAEGILYSCRAVRSLGRVDHKNTVLDNFELERARGITIFSKQARIEWEGLTISLLDTPGHVDFSAEMECTLQVLDYGILVIGGTDGVQGHVQTLWRLLKRYGVPVFIFVNKMDLPGADRKKLFKELRERLDANCVEFPEETRALGEQEVFPEEFLEELSVCSEELLEEYLETGSLQRESIARAVKGRQVFPCYFGAALRLQGVEELLRGFEKYALAPEYPEEFGARVFKIARDAQGNRLTYLKVTGGALRVKMPVDNKKSAGGGEIFEEKADQIRLYTGSQYQSVREASCGEICAVTGLTKTFAGQGLGREEENGLPVLEPILTYRIFLPEDWDLSQALLQLRQLEEEEPQLHILWKEELSEIHVQVMGEVQIEVLKSILKERFGLPAEFGAGSIVYKETIAEPVVGIGHFEPLRHYAEVHLLLEPGEPGSGLQLASRCSEDVLDKNWQRLVLTHLEEKTHAGVLTGSEITDMRITLLAGRAHQKHTEGGDFRQATYRALRQGLRKSRSVLLEPYFSFQLEVPSENLGRAMSDIQRKSGTFEAPVTEGESSILRGSAPAAALQDYQQEVRAYTRGRGQLSCELKGYFPCHNAEEVVESIGYDCDGDTENPAGSVFCAHGAGFLVSWDRVEEYAHVDKSAYPQRGLCINGSLETEQEPGVESAGDFQSGKETPGLRVKETSGRTAERDFISQEEIEEIFRQTYGKKPEDKNHYRRYHRGGGSGSELHLKGGGNGGADKAREGAAGRKPPEKEEQYLLVDGYNIIFAWEELRELAGVNIDSARDRLMDILSNYQGTLGGTLILVFDAYKVKGGVGSVVKYHNIYVVYTKEAETADQYIERTVHSIGRKHRVTVATSDGLEQMIIWGDGAARLSAAGLKEAVEASIRELRENYLS